MRRIRTHQVAEPKVAEAVQVKRQFDDALRAFPNVTGVGVGYRVRNGIVTRETVIRVYVSRKLPLDRLRPEDVIPPRVAGVEVDVIEDEFVIHTDLSLVERRAHQIQLQAGISVAGARVTAGTLGTVLSDACGRDLILSNWHVLAGSLFAQPGEPILQPGPVDGGTGDHVIARLERFALSQHLDAACASLDGHRFCSHDHAGLGRRPLGTIGPVLGLEVFKSGRTTGVTHGRITDVDADVTVGGYPDGPIDFKGQIIVEPDDRAQPFSRPGDSGSVVLAANGPAVGLLFGGSIARTILNPIDDVAIALRLDFGVHPLPNERDFLDLTID